MAEPADVAEAARKLAAAVSRLRSLGVAMRVRARKLADELPGAKEPAGIEALSRRVLESSALAERLVKRARRSAEEALAALDRSPPDSIAPASDPVDEAAPDVDTELNPEPKTEVDTKPFECRVVVKRSTDPRFLRSTRPLIRCVSPSRLMQPKAFEASESVVVAISSDSELEGRPAPGNVNNGRKKDDTQLRRAQRKAQIILSDSDDESRRRTRRKSTKRQNERFKKKQNSICIDLDDETSSASNVDSTADNTTSIKSEDCANPQSNRDRRNHKDSDSLSVKSEDATQTSKTKSKGKRNIDKNSKKGKSVSFKTSDNEATSTSDKDENTVKENVNKKHISNDGESGRPKSVPLQLRNEKSPIPNKDENTINEKRASDDEQSERCNSVSLKCKKSRNGTSKPKKNIRKSVSCETSDNEASPLSNEDEKNVKEKLNETRTSDDDESERSNSVSLKSQEKRNVTSKPKKNKRKSVSCETSDNEASPLSNNEKTAKETSTSGDDESERCNSFSLKSKEKRNVASKPEKNKRKSVSCETSDNEASPLSNEDEKNVREKLNETRTSDDDESERSNSVSLKSQEKRNVTSKPKKNKRKSVSCETSDNEASPLSNNEKTAKETSTSGDDESERCNSFSLKSKEKRNVASKPEKNKRKSVSCETSDNEASPLSNDDKTAKETSTSDDDESERRNSVSLKSKEKHNVTSKPKKNKRTSVSSETSDNDRVSSMSNDDESTVKTHKEKGKSDKEGSIAKFTESENDTRDEVDVTSSKNKKKSDETNSITKKNRGVRPESDDEASRTSNQLETNSITKKNRGVRPESDDEASLTSNQPEKNSITKKNRGVRPESDDEASRTSNQPEKNSITKKNRGVRLESDDEASRTSNQPEKNSITKKNRGVRLESDDEASRTSNQPEKNSITKKNRGVRLESDDEASSTSNQPEKNSITKKNRGVRPESDDEASRTSNQPEKNSITKKHRGVRLESDDEASSTSNQPEKNSIIKKNRGVRLESDDEASSTSNQPEKKSITKKNRGVRLESDDEANSTSNQPEKNSITKKNRVVRLESDDEASRTSNQPETNITKKNRGVKPKSDDEASRTSNRPERNSVHGEDELERIETVKEKLVDSNISKRNRSKGASYIQKKYMFTPEEVESYALDPDARQVVKLHMEQYSAVVSVVRYPEDEVAFQKYLTDNKVVLCSVSYELRKKNEAIKRDFLKSSDSEVSSRGETSHVDASRLLKLKNKAASKRKKQKTEKRHTKLNSSDESDENRTVKKEDVSSDSSDLDDDIASNMPRIKSSKPTSLSASELLDDSSSDTDNRSSKMNGVTQYDKDGGDSKKNNKNHNNDVSDNDSKSRHSDSSLDDNDEENGGRSNAKDETLGGTDSNDSEVFKPTKRKRKKTKSSGESSGDQSSSDKKSKKRKRIKQVSGDDSDRSGGGDGGGGSSSESEGGTKKHGRKNIRKVKKSKNLHEATRTAARIEKERIQRIADRQKLYNESMFDESGRPDEVKKLEKVDLDFDPDTKKAIISVDRGIVEKLKPHQANGIKFMWDACFESVKQIESSKGSGCILAHCMGLGKTLQVVALVHTLLTHQKLTNVERVLVVCPLSTVLNWVNEFRMWLKHAKCKDDIEIYEISKYKQNYERSNQLKEWIECGGVCVLGYDMFRNLSADNSKKFRKAQLSVFQRALVDPGPDLVVCDEGHLLKNEKTSLSQSMNRVKTLRRIVLTGTPLQNNLKEYYCMVQFVKPDLLGKYNEYLNRFVNPITNGQYTDSTEHDIRVMKRRSHVLHKMLDGAVQRRDYAVLAPFLPPKHEYVLFITLTDIQIKLYSHYMENYSRRPQPDRKNTGFLFADFQSLQRVWTHPLVLKANSERYEIMQQKKREKEEEEDSEGSLIDFIDDEETTTPDETSSDDDDSLDSDNSNPPKKKKSKKPKKSHKRVTRAARAADSDEPIEIKCEDLPPDVKVDNPTEWWMSLCSEDELDDVRHSNKLVLLLEILKMCEAIGDKLLVFSQSLYSLDLIEQSLWKIDEATQKGESNEKLAGHLGSWSPGIDYFRLDGSSSCENRAIWCKSFNKEDNPRARLFLISTRAGGLGINLVAANRVVIFDMSWNPSHDVQSIFRVYRFGQKKPCYIYRFLALGTMEEKIYERQVTKQAISKRVIDEQQIDRHYAESDLAELYTFCPVPEGVREVPKLPKDRLFADLFKAHDATIYKYHEHDSLLENKEEETLTEEERKAAWEDYENEKTRPPISFGNQFLAGYQQQQQHHMALSALLQQDYPGLSEQQVTGMVPALLQQLYQNGDPLLMQKMNSMMAAQNNPMGGFKYPQVNSNMMLNEASGTSGSSNFTPTWQQQQQLQLQRLQQQQALQANLKYYAGGLGSRDTMDMAALQQRQRAMMMSTAPSLLPTRGRPPKNPRAPIIPPPIPTDTGEIYEIDSE